MTRGRVHAKWILAIALAVLFVSIAAAYFFAEMPGGVDSRCMAVGRALSGPLDRDWEPLEAITVTGSFQWWPVGRSCLWTAADGDPSVRAEPDPTAWLWTALVWGSGVIATLAAILSTTLEK